MVMLPEKIPLLEVSIDGAASGQLTSVPRTSFATGIRGPTKLLLHC